jgi:hypothetical protein
MPISVLYQVPALGVGLAGYLRDGVTVAEAADILWTCTSVEAYEILLLRG